MGAIGTLRGLRAGVVIVLCAAALGTAVATAPAAARPTRTQQAIGPGTVLERIREAGPGGPIEAYVIRVDLADPGVRAGLLYPGSIAAVRTVSAMASAAGAFAAINGDFFNIGESGAPVGPVVDGARLLKAPQPGRGLAAGVGTDGLGRISNVSLQGFVTLPGGRRALSDLNDANPGYPPMLAPDGVGLFTPAWGSYPRAGAVRGLRPVAEALIHDGRVVRVSDHAGGGPVPAGSYVLLGAGAGARALARLRIGQAVSVTYGQRTTAPVPFQFAIGGKYWLVRGGVVQGGLPTSGGASRTAVGFADRGRTMYLVATEGSRAGVPGLDLPDLATFVRGLGVSDAVNLDDGGSTTIVVRLPGRAGLTLLNRPDDGAERRVANGIGLFAMHAS
ncbi:MAG TPA: phosphodiester glycosidase family protein [Solirubrobacteraceae bacterium]|nr:phosphodiester glycosidase family protein [Solirubrobacteraceae bacterium]